MTQPPPGPPPQDPPPPGPPPGGFPAPYGSGGPYGPPSHHGPPGPPGARPPSPGLPAWAKTVFGFLIGLPLAIFSLVVALGIGTANLPVEVLVLLVTVVPPLFAAPLLFVRSTRPWAVGAMLGLGIGSFVLGGACVSLLAGY